MCFINLVRSVSQRDERHPPGRQVRLEAIQPRAYLAAKGPNLGCEGRPHPVINKGFIFNEVSRCSVGKQYVVCSG